MLNINVSARLETNENVGWLLMYRISKYAVTKTRTLKNIKSSNIPAKEEGRLISLV
jgi:hypothetical protein